jgi:hypothetical protein
MHAGPRDAPVAASHPVDPSFFRNHGSVFAWGSGQAPSPCHSDLSSAMPCHAERCGASRFRQPHFGVMPSSHAAGGATTAGTCRARTFAVFGGIFSAAQRGPLGSKRRCPWQPTHRGSQADAGGSSASRNDVAGGRDPSLVARDDTGMGRLPATPSLAAEILRSSLMMIRRHGHRRQETRFQPDAVTALASIRHPVTLLELGNDVGGGRNPAELEGEILQRCVMQIWQV